MAQNVVIRERPMWERSATLTDVALFEFTCVECGPFLRVPLEDIRTHRAGAPLSCPTCGGPISIDVVHELADNEASADR